MSSKSNSSNGVSFLGLLGVLFIGLKLTNYIDWSWWYVTLPLWGGLALVFVILGGYLIYGLAKIKIISSYRNKQVRKNKSNDSAKKSRFQQRIDNAMESQRKSKGL